MARGPRAHACRKESEWSRVVPRTQFVPAAGSITLIPRSVNGSEYMITLVSVAGVVTDIRITAFVVGVASG